MKLITAFILLAIFILFYSCGNKNNESKTATAETEESNGATQHETKVEGRQGDGLFGEWQLTGVTTDDNRNSQLDETERKNAITQAHDYLKLNSDGSCLFYAHKVKGRYELKPESDGGKLLVLYDKNDNKENRGKVLSVSKDELVLFKAGSTFSVYKRL